MPSITSLADQIIKKALEIGFDACSIVPAIPNEKHHKIFTNWISSAKHAEMSYLEKNNEIRWDQTKLVKNAKSIIVLLASYHHQKSENQQTAQLAKYAKSIDYHQVLKTKMHTLLSYIKTLENINGRCFVDSAPLPERSYASMAGLGIIGKNTCLINEQLGSWFVIGEIIIDKEITHVLPQPKKHCGNCTLCIEACPTGALSPYQINANLCISYQTIENKNDIPKLISDKITNQFFGCDICQNVCPFNKDPLQGKMLELKPLKSLLNFDTNSILQMSQTEFKEKYEHTALYRTGLKKLQENITHIKLKKP